MYFAQLVGAVHTKKIVDILFCRFQIFFCIFIPLFIWKTKKNDWKSCVFSNFLKLVDTQKLNESWKGYLIFGSILPFLYFNQLWGAFSTWKLIKIHNTQKCLFSYFYKNAYMRVKSFSPNKLELCSTNIDGKIGHDGTKYLGTSLMLKDPN